MKLRYYHNFRNEEGFIETQDFWFHNIDVIWFENQDYCDNGKWLFIKKKDELKPLAIQFYELDDFEILGE